MKLGWVDFSKSDRDKAMETLNLLKDTRAVDELGFGRIRDAFANHFFPGTSTIQTRAKYFLIIPYAFQTALKKSTIKNSRQFLREVEDNIEKECAQRLIELHKSDEFNQTGIIGKLSINNRTWVLRKPSSIYWNGIKTWGIMTKNINMSQYAELAIKQRDQVNSMTDIRHSKGKEDTMDLDDNDAGGGEYQSFWSVPTPENWMEELKIELTREEAKILRTQINTRLDGTLLKLYLDNYSSTNGEETFPELVNLLKDQLSEEEKSLTAMAIEFDELTYLAKVRFNIMLTQNNDSTLLDEWDDLIEIYGSKPFNIDWDKLFFKLKISNGDWGLKSFLKSLETLVNQVLKKEVGVDKLDELIRKRERNIKQGASKLANANRFSPTDRAGYNHFDYRFSVARRLIKDIITAEQNER